MSLAEAWFEGKGYGRKGSSMGGLGILVRQVGDLSSFHETLKRLTSSAFPYADQSEVRSWLLSHNRFL